MGAERKLAGAGADSAIFNPPSIGNPQPAIEMTEDHRSGAIRGKFEESRAKRGRALDVRGPADLLAVAVATGLGAGFAPVAPGTFGSLVGLAIFYALASALRLEARLLQNAVLVGGVILAAAGVWASNRAERIFGKEDAGQIVIDEVCGQLISFAFVAPFLIRATSSLGRTMLAGFVLFRLCDIFKPYPVRRLEALGAGLGVMADDVLAGIYAAVMLSLLLTLELGI